MSSYELIPEKNGRQLFQGFHDYEDMKYVYILKSLRRPDQLYVGVTFELRQRLEDHNSRKCPHTSKFIPWELVCFESFQDSSKAFKRERQIKH